MRSVLLSILLISAAVSQTHSISGTVLNEENQPIAGVNISSGTIGTTSNSEGKFTLEIKVGESVTFHHIAYQTLTIAPETTELNITLKSEVLQGEEVFISATRAVAGVTPVAFSNLTEEEISDLYTVEDVPMILAGETGVYAYSESGNGTGYSYVSIRGFDQSKIAVMMDNVPLNDNESHQVYWVDHTDILSDAKDVQIQRGIGNSLYGSAAFGGSINVTTKIHSDSPYAALKLGHGSFNTSKYSLDMNSGNLFKNLSLKARYSQTESDGYRDEHESFQRGFSFGAEHRTEKMTNQFRALIGYENTDLTWDGIYASDIDDREKRREGYKAYTDDFLQLIYSLNIRYTISPSMTFTNTAYLVAGEGYYEVFKYDQDWYSYNLDVADEYTDDEEKELYTDLLRRKWILNAYVGIVPALTLNKENYRLDIGGEFRYYKGDHFGQVKDFSNEAVNTFVGNVWYRYYQYTGYKQSLSLFTHLAYDVNEQLKFVGDIQFQQHDWSLDQQKIGHALGHQLSAKWPFVNPRVGLIYKLDETMSVFANYGTAQKEPADNQIISADDVWSEPVKAAAEVIHDVETGFTYQKNKMHFGMNLYRIDYENEQLKNIDVEQEGEYDYYAADATVHQGAEFDFSWVLRKNMSLNINGSYHDFTFVSGDEEGNTLPATPKGLLNISLNHQLIGNLNTFYNIRYVGEQFLDKENIGKIDPYTLMNLGLSYETKSLIVRMKINNLTDILYSTFGYGYEWDGYHAYYWPGATRNWFVSMEYKL